MKTKLLLILFTIPLFAFAQKDYDVRKVSWGMTPEQVLSSEKPLVGKYVENQIDVNKVDVGNGFSAHIYYRFSNRKLVEVRYSIYKKDYNASEPKLITVPFVEKVLATEYIIDALKEKGFECKSGWALENMTSKEQLEKFGGLKNCELDEETVKKVGKLAETENAITAHFNLENTRSKVKLSYNEFQNKKGYKYVEQAEVRKMIDFMIDDVYLWITFEPKDEILDELNKNRF